MALLCDVEAKTDAFFDCDQKFDCLLIDDQTYSVINVLSFDRATEQLNAVATDLTGLPVVEFDYPELQVTPSASQRLNLEAKEEKSKNFKSLLPYQVSAAMTIASGIVLAGAEMLGCSSTPKLNSAEAIVDSKDYPVASATAEPTAKS